MAWYAMGAVVESFVITVLVSAIGWVIIGVLDAFDISSRLQFGINGGGVLRVMPADANISRNSASQNSNVSMWVVFGSRVHARRPVALSIGMAR